MEQIEPIAAYFPYMTCPGNHEHKGFEIFQSLPTLKHCCEVYCIFLTLLKCFQLCRNFSQYKNRFTMPGKANSMMYSWNMGPIHFVSFSTEVFYYLQYGIKPIVTQYQWLKKDLEVRKTIFIVIYLKLLYSGYTVYLFEIVYFHICNFLGSQQARKSSSTTLDSHIRT